MHATGRGESQVAGSSQQQEAVLEEKYQGITTKHDAFMFLLHDASRLPNASDVRIIFGRKMVFKREIKKGSDDGVIPLSISSFRSRPR